MIDGRLIPVWTTALVMALAGPFLPLLAAPSGKGDVLLVVAPPWRDVLAVIETAGGRPIGPATGWLGAFATSDGPDFSDRLSRAGAWASVDNAALAALCGVDVTWK